MQLVAVSVDQREIERRPVIVPPELLVMHFHYDFRANCVDLGFDRSDKGLHPAKLGLQESVGSVVGCY
jgi:hypothetical protein